MKPFFIQNKKNLSIIFKILIFFPKFKLNMKIMFDKL